MLKLEAQLSPHLRVKGGDWDCLMVSNNNEKLFGSSYSSGKLWVWSSSSLDLLQEFEAHPHPICHMTPEDPNSLSSFFTSSSDCSIKAWKEAEEGGFECICTMEGHQEPPRRLRYDVKKGRLFSGDDLGQVLIWKDGICLQTLQVFEEVWDMVVHENLLITVRHMDVVLHSLNDKDDKIRSSVKQVLPGRGPLLVTPPGDDKLLYVDRLNFDIVVNHAVQPRAEPIGKLQGHTAIVNAVAQIGKNLIISGGSDGKLMVWDIGSSFQNLASTDFDGGVINCIAVVVDGKGNVRIFVGGQDKTLSVFNFSRE